LDDPPKDSDWEFGSMPLLQILNPECMTYGTGTHEGKQTRVMIERKQVLGDEPPKHFYRYLCPCWNMFMGFTLVHHLEKRYVEQQHLAGVFSPKALGLKVRPIWLQNLEAIMDKGGDKQSDRLMEILSKHIQQVWVESLKPMQRTARLLKVLQVLHTKHRVRVTPSPTMIRRQLNKLEHTWLLSDKNLATLSAEINLYDPLISHYNWSDLLKVAIDKVVEVGKEHAYNA